MIDTNAIIRTHLLTDTDLVALVGARIYCPRIPEKSADLEQSLSYFTRGGTNDPYIPGRVVVSVQFDCWADNPIDAREVYRALYDALQGIQNVSVGSDYIISATEEVAGQDLVDTEIQGYFRVLTFFSIIMR